MTKEEALNKIDELKKFVEEYDKVEPNIITRFPTREGDMGKINGEWAFSLFAKEAEGNFFPGSEQSGHEASMFLCSNNGDWFTDNGTKIRGYLFYKPKNW